MFQTTVIASGSKGNCVLVQTSSTAILLDAGISMRRIFDAMEELDISPNKLAAILVSHEHGDHTRSVGAVSRKLRIPIMLNRPTLAYCGDRIGNVQDRITIFQTGSTFTVGDITIEAFASSHDAAEGCNFCLYPTHEPQRKLGVATDLGYPSQLSVLKLSAASTLILESNHDETMLMNGPYDWHLKQRIRSAHGHLSNIQAVGLLTSVLHPGLKNLILAHLSETNNDPTLAESTMRSYLESVRSDINLLVAMQDRHTPLIDV
ncbi:MAG: MBL fold metallo-hydrolase [Candidatus Cloacimonetes bacterium HGW-Cloacimonetes-3]|jgi:phosphoribosyl 1,2-cyclic phosphodiesterase|nr:MAG: MBL fold metallo-hydrolase [Candidatus Cloacimonetes bacterium HGW-Cloacimonetes-3]